MIVIVWRFVAKAERVREFESRYSGEGDWAQLFARAEGYIGTEMWRAVDEANTYLVLDRWDSAEHFSAFKAKFQREYEALDRMCEALTEREEKVGVFGA
ncbi:MAG: antibiotic biosynthesis monooxygenase [Acidobacteriales bacterium]|nr:antibiotic biosynthesis monooxygenase [Terriglobales bacterium]